MTFVKNVTAALCARFNSYVLTLVILTSLFSSSAFTQSFSTSSLNFNGKGSISNGTSLMFGPDGRLYALQLDGTIKIMTVSRSAANSYLVDALITISQVKNIPNHNDDGTSNSGSSREATGLTVAGTASNPIVFVTSSDSRVGGPSGDKDLDTNSGVITQLTWVGNGINDPNGFWKIVDIVRGLPRSEENHATNGLEFVTIGTTDYLIVSQGGHTNAGSPSTNFAWVTEYALAAAVLSVNLTQINAMPILMDGAREYVYNLPTLDDPTRANTNGIIDPALPGYNGIDINDPWGGNDGLNQAKIVVGGPVQIFSPGYRNTYDLVVTKDGKVYVTDNGANGGWGGYPVNEGLAGTVTNNYRPGEPGSSGTDVANGNEPGVNNKDHLTIVTNNIQTYTFGSFYGGHPAPVRANPTGAGLFTRGIHSEDIGDVNGNTYTDDWFRTQKYNPSGTGEAADPKKALPADWPPVPFANPIEGDFRNPDGPNPDGPADAIIAAWGNNTNGIDEYTASNFNNAMKGNLIAGKSGGTLHRVQVNANGSLQTLTQNFISGLGGNPLGITCNDDDEIFPGTIWVATFDNSIKILEPQDFIICLQPGDAGYLATGDNDQDGYTNQDEIDNGTDPCNGGSLPQDYDDDKISDKNDLDDDGDGINDNVDAFQIGSPFSFPVVNELFSDNVDLGGYRGLGLTGLMNNGAANPNWLDWLDVTDAGPNPNDILGGAVGAITMQMTDGTALGTVNSQKKGFQFGVNVDQSHGIFTVESRMLNFAAPLQLYGNTSTPGAELGMFIGDGTQSNYIKFVVKQSGFELRQEINDVPQTALTTTLAEGSRPNGSIQFILVINPVSGSVEAKYSIDGGVPVSLGSIVAEGSILAAIQQVNQPLAIGVIGCSNAAGNEVEGTWDYFKVLGSNPGAVSTIPSIVRNIGDGPVQIDLSEFFIDNGGVENLVYSVISNTNSAVSTSISNSIITITVPTSEGGTAVIVVRATDAEGQFAEQSINVTINDEPEPIIRINAGGPQVAATDGGPNWLVNSTAGAISGTGYTVNTGAIYASGIPNKHASTPTYVPQSIFATERYDAPAAPEMTWSFPLANGSYQVRLYLGNGFAGTDAVGDRVFDINIEGNIVDNDFDPILAFGHQNGGTRTYNVTLTDGTLDIQFIHGIENPNVCGIEILRIGSAAEIPIVLNAIGAKSNAEGEDADITVIASGGDGNLQFTATGLPPGVSIDPTQGLIGGTIQAGATANSPYTVVVTVDDSDGNADDKQTASFQWTITSSGINNSWINKNENESYTGRHECSFVQAGDKFYLLGGRENGKTPNVYDFQTNTWTNGAVTPSYPYPLDPDAPTNLEFNHYQATEYQGLIWIIGAFRNNNFPNEIPADSVYLFDPANNEWRTGHVIPAERRRGSAGLVVYNNKFYVVGGNQDGHDGEYVNWFDEYDPATGIWTTLPNAPRQRDHFHAAVVGNKLYAVGGRLTGGPGGTFAPLIPEVDVYDFSTGTWSTLPSSSNLPIPRAASATVAFEGKVYVIGGEGNGQAYPNVHALDPATNTWETKANLNFPRHGTQGIVSGNGIHITAGSPNQGGGSQKNMEVYNVDNPVGVASVAATISTPASATVATGGFQTLSIEHSGGNQGLFVSSIEITGANAANFNVTGNAAKGFFIPIGGNKNIQVQHTGTAGQTANLVLYYGQSATKTIVVTSGAVTPVVLYRINTGGETITDPGGNWQADQSATTANGTAVEGTPSQYVNFNIKDQTYGADPTGFVNNTGYPAALFNTERYSDAVLPVESMKWDFPVQNGTYTVNLLFAERWTGANTAGQRVFDVNIEGVLLIDNLDQTAKYGYNTAGVESFVVTVTDGHLNIDFLKGVENPNIKGIEILGGGQGSINNAPTVTNPGVQNSIDGQNIVLPIVASDDDNCGSLTYSATGLPPGLTINPTTGVITGTLPSGSGSGSTGAFIEENGWVVFDVESQPAAGEWDDSRLPADIPAPISGALGGAYYEWKSGNASGGVDAAGNTTTLTYRIKIAKAGRYRVQWRSSAPNSTEHNDSWLGISGTGSKAVALQGTPSAPTATVNLNNALFKVYQNSGGNTWSWTSSHVDNNAHQVYFDFATPGIYEVKIGGRSTQHKIDRVALYNVVPTDGIGAISNGQSTANLNAKALSSVEAGTVGASDGSPYNVSVTVADACTPAASSNINFTWNVTETAVGTATSALIQVNPGGGLTASTFDNNSFKITNTGDVKIQKVTIDLSKAVLRDLAFDPVGTAGDATAKCLTPGSDVVGTPGFVSPSNLCTDPFSLPHNGIDNQEGYDMITLNFNDFNGGEKFSFGVDIDPTSIKNDATSGDAGSVSGFELIGAVVTVEFENGTTLSTSLFDDGSMGGSKATVSALSPVTAPSVTRNGSAAPAVLSDANQTITVTGTPGASITLLRVDARLYIDAGGGGYDIDPFEANEAMAKTIYNGVLNGSGILDIPVILLQTASTNAGPSGGLNHFIAVIKNAANETGPASNVLVLQYDPNAQVDGTLSINLNLEGRATTGASGTPNHGGQYMVRFYNVSSTLVYDFMPEADNNGNITIEGLTPGAYKVAIKHPHFLQGVYDVIISGGANTLNAGMFKAGDANGDNFVSILDFSILASSFNKSVGDIGFDSRADFNGDGIVSILDFSLLATNFNQQGMLP